MIRLLVVGILSFINLFGTEASEKTLVIVKPDAVKAKHIGEIISRFEKNDLKVSQIKMTVLTEEQAKAFYMVHQHKAFFNDLVQFMISGPIVPIVLEGPHAIAKTRELIGTTDYRQALPGTIRKDFASSVTQNAVHASDSVSSAQTEIDFFFKIK